MVYERPSYGSNKTLLVNTHIAAQSKDYARSETHACHKRLIVE